MTGLGLTVVYLAVAVYTARAFTVRATHSWVNEFGAAWVDEGDRRMHAAVGVLVGLVWPGYWIGRALTGTLMATVPPTDDELIAERDAARRRIQELERDLGVGGQS